MTLNLHLDIPAEVVQRLLTGTDYAGVVLGQEPDRDREAIGEILDERLAADFHEYLDYVDLDAEADVDW